MLYRIDAETFPRIGILGRTNENPPWRHNGRTTGYSQLILVVSGTCTLDVEERHYTATAGEVLFIPAGLFYKLRTRDHCEYYFACFYTNFCVSDEKSAMEVCSMKYNVTAPDFFVPDPGPRYVWLYEHCRPDSSLYHNMLSLFSRCQRLYATQNYLDRMTIDALFYEILMLAGHIACNKSKPSQYPLSLVRMMMYINESYTEQITPELLSERFSLSKEHICSLFRKHLDKTVSEYVHSIKLEHAAELLLNSSMNTNQIAEYLGYSSIYYFSKLFKKHYSMSPTQYIVTFSPNLLH